MAKSQDKMIQSQIISRGISEPRLITALHKVPRKSFVNENEKDLACSDSALPIGYGQTISQPFIVALMTDLLELNGNERVLEIGTGSGYQTAVLAELAKEVYTVERIEPLYKSAKETLLMLDYKNIHFHLSDGTLGWPENAPYERIMVTAAARDIPEALAAQLGEKGVMVIPVGEKHSQNLIRIRKENGMLKQTSMGLCVFVPLVGKFGMEND